jgi:O-succinylbenzoic acid--CoA ligase
MPLFHVGGVSIILRSILYGSGIFHLPEFEKKEVAHQLSTDTDIVAVSLVPTMLKRLIESGEFAVHEAFQAVLLGGGPVSPNLIETCIEKNIPVITSYGMTETCAQIAANPILEFPDDDDRLQSAGRIFKPNKIDVRDQHNQSVPTGISGSIWIKGPQVFDGYYEKNSDKCGNSDWFNTGDYGHVDESGWMFIEARRTDLIITGGENVSPKEVENTLEQFKPIKEAAVFGIPDEEWGQRIAAALVLFPSASINQKDLKNRLKKELAAFKVPKQFFFVDQIPRTHNGKIKRAELRKFIDTQNSIFL